MTRIVTSVQRHSFGIRTTIIPGISIGPRLRRVSLATAVSVIQCTAVAISADILPTIR